MLHIKQSFKTGFGFGITSAIIATLGLMIGLESGTNSKIVVIGGILTIAVADAFSDALGIHISQETHQRETNRHIWEATIATFLTKFFITLTFAIPILLLDLNLAMAVSVGWGILILGILSYLIGKNKNGQPWRVVGEHLLIAFLVIIITHYLGSWIALVVK